VCTTRHYPPSGTHHSLEFSGNTFELVRGGESTTV
jgi:hypothetical protein